MRVKNTNYDDRTYTIWSLEKPKAGELTFCSLDVVIFCWFVLTLCQFYHFLWTLPWLTMPRPNGNTFRRRTRRKYSVMYVYSSIKNLKIKNCSKIFFWNCKCTLSLFLHCGCFKGFGHNEESSYTVDIESWKRFAPFPGKIVSGLTLRTLPRVCIRICIKKF